MNKFYKRLAILILLVLVISGSVIYFTVDINTLSNLTGCNGRRCCPADVFASCRSSDREGNGSCFCADRCVDFVSDPLPTVYFHA